MCYHCDIWRNCVLNHMHLCLVWLCVCIAISAVSPSHRVCDVNRKQGTPLIIINNKMNTYFRFSIERGRVSRTVTRSMENYDIWSIVLPKWTWLTPVNRNVILPAAVWAETEQFYGIAHVFIRSHPIRVENAIRMNIYVLSYLFTHNRPLSVRTRKRKRVNIFVYRLIFLRNKLFSFVACR